METFEIWDAPLLLPLAVYATIALAVISVTLITLTFTAWRRKLDDDGKGLMVFLSLIGVGAVWLLGVFLPSSVYQDNSNHEYRVTQLEKLGYEYVELTGTKFTASSDGKFVRGTLMEEAGMIHVLEIPSE